MFTLYAMGWTLWNLFVCSLAIGVRVFLLCGSPYYLYQGKKNMWDMMAEHNASWSFFVPSILDKLQKMNFKLDRGLSMDSLKMVTVGGCPVKTQNIDYLQNNVKKDLFVGTIYGATEITAGLSGFNLNLPCYACEIQAPALGKDVRCFDPKGRPIVDEVGEVVITNSSPAFPLKLWKDDNNKLLNATYLDRYPGIWRQNDECIFKTDTRGIVVRGRSDETLIQHGDRFTSNDIYLAIHDLPEVRDYICVAQTRPDGDTRAVLFVKTQKGVDFTPQLREKIVQKIDEELWMDCVPQLILPVPDIPYNQNNKRMERVVRQILATNRIPEVLNIMNPECLKNYQDIPEILEYSK